MVRSRLDSLVRVLSKAKMIKTAPSDLLRPPLGASAIQPHAKREVQPTSRPVDNSPLKFHKAARHHLAVITAVGSLFCRPSVRGYARRCAAKNRSGDPICQEELVQRFPPLTRGARSSVMRQDDHRGSLEYKNTCFFDPRDRQCPKRSTDVQFSLKIWDFTFRLLLSYNANGGQTHS